MKAHLGLLRANVPSFSTSFAFGISLILPHLDLYDHERHEPDASQARANAGTDLAR